MQAKGRGASVVVFDIRHMRGDKWPLEVARKRFYSILEPGAALAGLPCETFDGSRTDPTNARGVAIPGGGPLVDYWRECERTGAEFPRLASPRGTASAHDAQYTVTLRKTQRSPLRDSNEAVWRDFAAEIGAYVIPDYDEVPIHLHERMALYAGAQMNFFVSNGPGVLCSLTRYPCMLFNTHHARESLIGDGLAERAQYPWMLANQRAIWEEATPESLRAHFYHWRETGTWLDEAQEKP